ncbi:class I SAM-dependent methyltransferase [Virgibacillus ndiopensis]|uniref:class I SAM-dependent methyltransferase n=1 Tax=Virgibacillus ndiopensis TaxID=2004408 RepID=UPI000C078CA2|nr:class I SAM-dependent methyltransferase [Virgibacillus ndiopensis]
MKEKDHVKEVFSKNKEAYVSSSTHSSGVDLPLMIEWLNPETTMIALDIATGGGHVAKQLSGHVGNIIATDLTEEMLENTAQHLNSFNNISYKVADAENLPFDDNAFDIVTCRIAAHHFPNPEKFVSEVSRVLKSGGQFIFIDNIAPEDHALDKFNNTLEKMRDYSHVRSRTVSEWKNIFDEYGLKILKEETRKKTLPYREWVTRTLDNKNDRNKVEQFIMDASGDIKKYFQVKVEDGSIESFAIDEWMVLSWK